MTAPELIPDLSVGASCDEHAVQFYSDAKFLLQKLETYVIDALSVGGSAVVIATPEHRQALASSLEKHGFGPAVTGGRYFELDAAGTLSRFVDESGVDSGRFNEVICPVLELAGQNVTQGSPLAAYGEMVALLVLEGKAEAAIQLEHLWNQLRCERRFSLLCGYPLHAFSGDEHGEQFLRVCAEHSEVVPAETSPAGEDADLRSVARLQQLSQVLDEVRGQREKLQERASEIQVRNLELIEEIKKKEISEERLRKVTSHLIALRDEEQRRIAAELHENTAQELAVLGMNLDLLRQEYRQPSTRAQQILEQSSTLVQELLREVRTLSHVLHPPLLGPLGLSPALQSLVQEFTASTGIAVDLDVSKSIQRLSAGFEFTIFRIVQELLSHLHQSRRSPSAKLRLGRDGGDLSIQVYTENSAHGTERPQPQAEHHSGLALMQERVQQLGGSFNIHADPNGTDILITLPTFDVTA